WTAADNVGVTAVDLDYSSNGGSTWTSIVTGLANSGSYSWTVANAPTTTARVRATARDAAANSASDASDANFTIRNPVVTASAGANGSISPSGAVSVAYNGSQTCTMTPATGYHVADVLVDGSSVGAVTSRTFSNVTVDHTISASFAINTYSITASAGAHGAISPSGSVSANHGANQSFTITPDAHYHVADVLVDGVSVGAVTSYAF